MDINQVEERAPVGTPRNLATIHENFSGFQAAASLQLRNFRSSEGGRGCRGLVAVDMPNQFPDYVRPPQPSGAGGLP